MIKKILINKENEYPWENGDLHTESGMLKESQIKKAKGVIKSNTGEIFYVFDAGFSDILKELKRGPAIMLPKDIGIILTTTNINKDSEVLDAGTGSGFLSATLSQFVKKVYTYENEKRFYKIAKENFESLELKNVALKELNIYEGIKEKNLDLIILDLSEPWKVLQHAKKSLKNGYFLVSYLPTITQVIELVKRTKEYNFMFIKTIELLEREWHVEEQVVRPKSKMIAHTGFIVFLRALRGN